MRGTVVVRSAVVLGLLLLPASSWAHPRPSLEDRAPNVRSGSGSFSSPAARALTTGSMLARAGAFVDPLPARSDNMQLIGKLGLKTPDAYKVDPTTGQPDPSEPDLVAGQIADVSVYKGFAYLASWAEPSCKRGGFFVVDIRNPANPVQTGFVPALDANYHGEGMHATTITTPEFSGDVLAVNNEECGIPEQGAKSGGFDLYDVSDPLNPKILVQGFGDFGGEGDLEGAQAFANQYHSVFIWDAGNTAYLVGVDNEEFHDIDIFDISDPRNPQPVREYDAADSFPAAWTETANGDNVFHHDMVVKQIGNRWVLLSSYWDMGYLQIDVTDPQNATLIADTDFTGEDPLTGIDPPEGNAHQAEFTNDNKYIVTAEEDFAAYRLIEVDVVGSGKFGAAEVGGGASPNSLPDGVLNGPMAYGGYGCPDTSPDGVTPAPVPDAETLFPRATLEPNEERIVVIQRGPTGDTDEDYNGNGEDDDACFPGEKADQAKAAGWDAVLLVNRHPGSDGPYCGSGAYTQIVVTACTTHQGAHAIFDDPYENGTPYNDTVEMATIGQKSAYKLRASGSFDGWGYMGLYSTTPDADGKMPMLDAYAIDEALDENYAQDFGDLTIHEQATDPEVPLTYTAYYAGGLRVFSYAGEQITEVGAFVDEGGSNFWGIEQFTASDGVRLMAGSDRDKGLFIARYTGPGAPVPSPSPSPAVQPTCQDTVAIVGFKASANVPLACSGGAGRTLTFATTNPSAGTLGAPAGGAVSYTHTGDRLGTDSFTFTAADGSLVSAAATARLTIGARDGGRCFNRAFGTASSERLTGSRFGDRITGAGGNDRIDGGAGADCLDGEAGNDRVSGGSGNDRVDGGAGRDTLSGNAGRDDLRGEAGNDKLSGGAGNDKLSGGAGRDTLSGGSGNDNLSGGSGNDTLSGGAGTNRYSGGAGRDTIRARNDRRERITCGGGRDTVIADRNDRVARDCERVRRG